MPSTVREPRRGTGGVALRRPDLRDGAAVWRLARDSGQLDLNTPYAYLLWCERFADTSIIAEVAGRPAGFVCGFRPPRQQNVLFVWQVAVAEDSKGAGVAARMLHGLLDREPGLRYLEATVTPSNVASRRLFRSIARSLDCPCRETPHIRSEDFPEANHDPETLFRIGPFDRNPQHSPSQETDR